MGRNAKAAERLRTKLQGKEDESSYEPIRNIRFREWGDQWRKALECKETTRESYLSTVTWATTAFGEKPVRQVQVADIARMNILMREAGISDSTRLNTWAERD